MTRPEQQAVEKYIAWLEEQEIAGPTATMREIAAIAIVVGYAIVFGVLAALRHL